MAGRMWLIFHVLAIVLSASTPLANKGHRPFMGDRRRVGGAGGPAQAETDLVGARRRAGRGEAGPAQGPAAVSMGRPQPTAKGAAPRRAKGTPKGAQRPMPKGGAKGRKPTPKGAKRPPAAKGAQRPMPKGGKMSKSGKLAARGKAAATHAAKKSFPNVFNKGKKPRNPSKQQGFQAAKNKKRQRQRRPQGAKNFKGGKGKPNNQRHKDHKLAGGVSEEKMLEFQAKQELQFKFVDTNGDGELTDEEVLAAMTNLTTRYDNGDVMEAYESLLLTRMKKHGWVTKIDTNKDGKLTFDEFKYFKEASFDAAKKRNQDLLSRQEAQFKLLDADGDGEVTSEEASATRTSLKEKFAASKEKGGTADKMEAYEGMLLRRMAKEDWMKLIDMNEDGRLTFDEFKLISKPQPRPQEL